MEIKEQRAQLYISRHRIGTDGRGIRTLVSFTGCPLDCKYCINPELKGETSNGKWYTPMELFDELRKDRWYFLCTGGGITFSGGEPFLHASFIQEFCEIISFQEEQWDIAIETSLHVPTDNIKKVVPFIRTYIVDIKDTNDDIYNRYTGGDLSKVVNNLDFLKELMNETGIEVVVRLPLIYGFNTLEDVEKSIKFINERYDSEFTIDMFEYVPDKAALPEPDGKRICTILKAVRKGLIKENGLDIKQPACKHKGNCLGTCPMCEAELETINHSSVLKYHRTMTDMDKYKKDLDFKPSLNRIDPIPLAGIPAPPETLLGDIRMPDDDSWDF